MPSIMTLLSGLNDRHVPLTQADLTIIGQELATAPNEKLVGRTFDRLDALAAKGLVDAQAVAALRANVARFQAAASQNDLGGLLDHVGQDVNGLYIDPSEFRFVAIEHNDSTILINKNFEQVVNEILSARKNAALFRAAKTPAEIDLVLAHIVLDYPADMLGIGMESESARTALAWELLARIDGDTNAEGAKAFEHFRFGRSNKGESTYKALQAFVSMAGLKPMSQQALAVRDGREKPFAFFAGQGANYLKDLNELLKEPSAMALYKELKPVFAKYNIDLDALLPLVDANQKDIETYYALNGVTTTLPVIALVQVMRERVMADYGFDTSLFAGVTGQSGGLPAAFFAAGSFDGANWADQKPAVPVGMGGYHSVQAYRNFIEWMCVEGQQMQKQNPIRYNGATTMEPLVAKGQPRPSATDIDVYFSKYHVTNLSISGIAYDPKNPGASDLGVLIESINAKYPDGSSYIYMSNQNTGATPTGNRAHFILMGGKGAALADLAKLIVLREAAGYSEAVQTVVSGFGENVSDPIANTRVSFAPHDKRELEPMSREHLAQMAKLGITLARPSVSIINNFTGADFSQVDGDYAQMLVDQQYNEPVFMPLVQEAALATGATAFYVLGPGHIAAIDTNLEASGHSLAMYSVAANDSTGVNGWARMTSSQPDLSFAHELTAGGIDESEIAKLSRMKGLSVIQAEGSLTLRLDDELSREDFQKLKAFFDSSKSSLFKLLQDEKISVDGVEQDKNPNRKLLLNKKNVSYVLKTDARGYVTSLSFQERDLEALRLSYDTMGSILLTEFTYPDRLVSARRIELKRAYTIIDDGRLNEVTSGFRAQTRAAYAADWGISYLGRAKEDVFSDTQEISRERLAHFAASLQSRNPKFVSGEEAHPHFLIEAMWKSMMTPAFVDELGLDFTRVIDEGKTIRMGVPIKPGDVITTESQIARVEDFNTTYSGRRVVVQAVATNQRGEVVGEVISSLVSRIPVHAEKGRTETVYANRRVADKIDFFNEEPVYTNEKKNVVAKGSLQIPATLADTYDLDPNRIHVSDFSAVLAGIPQGRIMQGLGTLAYINEQVMAQLVRDGVVRTVRGISNLKFAGFVEPGDELTYDITRTAHSAGEHQFQVNVKNAKGRVVMSYDVVGQGPKTAVVFTGQGSQYTSMGDDITSLPGGEAMLVYLQSLVPLKADGETPVIDLKEAMNTASQDTSQAQPMIMAYSYILFNSLQEQGLIPADAVYSGHSLGMWIALLAAGAIEPSSALKSVYQRGAAMQNYNDPKNPQGMIAVVANKGTPPLSGAQIDILKRFINDEGDRAGGRKPKVLDLANDNDPSQVVIGGHQTALAEAAPILTAWGYRVVPLSVANAFHTPLMAPASADFGKWIQTNGNPFVVPGDTELYMDIEGQRLSELGNGDKTALADIMTRQISTGVQWRATIQRMLKDGVRRFVEVGPASRYDKDKKATVGSGGGTLITMIEREAKFLVEQGLLDPKEQIEVVFANSILNKSKFDSVTFEAATGVSEFNKPRVAKPKAKAAESKASDPVVVPGVSPQAAPAPVQQGPAPISPAQVQAVIEGFVLQHQADIAAGKDVEALAAKLSSSLVGLGAGAVSALQMRLASLPGDAPVATPAQSGTGESAQVKVIRVLQAAYGKDKSAFTSEILLKEGVGIDSGEAGNAVEILNTGLGIVLSTDDISSLLSIGDLIKTAQSKGLKDASGSAAPVSLSAPSPLVGFERKALLGALAQLPSAASVSAPVAAMATLPPVPQASVQAVIDSFISENKVVLEAGQNGNVLSQALAQKLVALGGGARGALSSLLSAYAPAAAAAPSGSGESAEAKVIKVLQAAYGADKSAFTALTTLKDVGIDSGEAGNAIEKLNGGLGIVMSTDDLGSLVTVGDLVKAAQGKGLKDGGASSVSAASGKPGDAVIRKGIEQAIAQLPAPAFAAQVAMPSFAPVSAADVERVRADYFAASAGSGTVEGLAANYQTLGAGAVPALQARLSTLGASAAPVAATSVGTGESAEAKVIKVLQAAYGADKSAFTAATTLKDVGIDSGEAGNAIEKLNAGLGIVMSTDDLGSLVTVGDLVKAAQGKGLKDGHAASAAPVSSGALSADDKIDQQAIQSVLPGLQAQYAAASSQAAPATGANSAEVQELRSIVKELQGRIAALEAAKVDSARTGADIPVTLDRAGKAIDARDLEITRLKTIVDNVVKGTSPAFVYGLMQPNYNPNFNFGYGEVERNGGRHNLYRFVTDVRADRLPKTEYDLKARIANLANQLDEIGLSWLESFIANERANNRDDRVALLQAVYDAAAEGIRSNTIITAGVITIRAVNFVPEYGHFKRGMPQAKAVVRDEGTVALASEMKALADVKTPEDLDWLLSEGVDLRGVKVTMQQAGTLSGPAIAKLLQLGATIDLTERLGRADMQPNGQNTNDYLWHLYNDNATRGAQLNVIAHMQPGNPHDEERLINEYYDLVSSLRGFLDKKTKYDEFNHTRYTDAISAAVIPAADKAKLLDAVRKSDKLSDDDRASAIALLTQYSSQIMAAHLPQIYINGAAFADYSASVEKRGDPFSVLAILSQSSRFVALNLAKLHQKYNTGKQVIYMNYYSPNSAMDLGAKAEEMRQAIRKNKLPEVVRILSLIPDLDPEILEAVKDVLIRPFVSEEDRVRGLFSVLAGSGTYPYAKAMLGAGMVAGEALNNGLVYKDGRPILLEVSRKTGWGKSNGEAASIMAGNDFFTMLLEELAKKAGFKLLTMTGDQLSTVHLSGVLARFTGRRQETHLPYDDTFGFGEAATRGVLNSMMGEAKTTEVERHKVARSEWEAKQALNKHEPSELVKDGSIVDLNETAFVIDGDTSGRFTAKPGQIVLDPNSPELIAVTGYGAVGPLGPDALTIYRGMLANSRYRSMEGGMAWLGEYDFYRLAQSMGLDVAKFNVEEMAKSLGSTADDAKRVGGDWNRLFQDGILKKSGFQSVGEFVEFKVKRQVSFPEDVEQPITDDKTLADYKRSGFDIFQRPEDGSLYALAKAGQTYNVDMTVSLPVTVAGMLPGQTEFDFAGMGLTSAKDSRTGAHAAQMAKMFTAQILMSMGGYSPTDMQEIFGAKNMFVSIGTGLGDLKPFNEMTVNPIIDKKVANYLMAALLPDAAAGQVATEQLGAEGMALAVVAACSTGNASIVMAVKELFSRFFLESQTNPDINWAEAFAKVWIAGGVDYAATYNAVFGFDAVGAVIRDEWRKARELVQSHGSRPDDKERHGFVIGTGGGGQALVPLAKAVAEGLPIYSTVIGTAFMTDGNKATEPREAYGKGQRSSLFEAWDQARLYATDFRYTPEQAADLVFDALKKAKGDSFNPSAQNLSQVKFKASEKIAFAKALSAAFSLELKAEDVIGFSTEKLVSALRDQTRELKKNIVFVVMAHKTATGAGDPYEEESVRSFLSSVLPKGQFAHIIKTKAHVGHLLGGSSGLDSGLSPLVHVFKVIPGSPGQDNIADYAGSNPYLFHHKEAVDLNELYDDDTQIVLIRESAGFNAKNAAVFETRGLIKMPSIAEAISYKAKEIAGTMNERAQKRAERLGVRKMAFNLDTYPEVPVALYRDLYEVQLRSEAIAKAIVQDGRIFNFDKILDWVYEFPVNAGTEIHVDAQVLQRGTVNPKLTAQAQHNQYNAAKFAEASTRVQEILSTFDPAELADIGRMAREKGWDKQPLVFYGVSDGMGMRTLLALIASGAVKEIVGVHFDSPTDNTDPNKRALKGSSFNPEVIKAYAAAMGVTLNTINTNGILYDFKTGEPLPLQDNVAVAIESARQRSEVKDIMFFDYVAFGAPWRRADQDDMWVPTITEFGELTHVKVSRAATPEQGQAMTVNPMGHNHARLLTIFRDNGWLGEKSVTSTADWWGSESDDMLSGVYGGALLGDAKNIAKKEVAEFAAANPGSGQHIYFGYPAFLSFALNAIPGGTLTGLIGKRIYADIEAGVSIDNLDRAKLLDELRFYSMEELAARAVSKLLKGDLSGPKGNKVSVDTHEMAIAREIDRRFKIIGARLEATIEAKKSTFIAAGGMAGDFKPKLSQAESYEVLKEFVTADYLTYTYEHVKDKDDPEAAAKLIRAERQVLSGSIDALPLPERLQTEYPFFTRAYSKALNTADLAISVIDAGGIGTLAGDDLKPEELGKRIDAVQTQVGPDAALVVNLMWSNETSLRDAQIDMVIKKKPAAVSIGNGVVSKEVVEKFHKAGILVIQLAGSVAAAKSCAVIGVDAVIAERNYGPGHINTGEGSNPEVLIRKMRQALYDAKIPVIAGGGFVDAADVADAKRWGASAIQLDDIIAYSAESTYGAKAAMALADISNPVVDVIDADGKPLRVLNTPGAQQLIAGIQAIQAAVPDANMAKPLIAMAFAKVFMAAAKGDVKNGLFLAGSRISQVKIGEPIEAAFARLSRMSAESPAVKLPALVDADEPDENGGNHGAGGAAPMTPATPASTPPAAPDGESDGASEARGYAEHHPLASSRVRAEAAMQRGYEHLVNTPRVPMTTRAVVPVRAPVTSRVAPRPGMGSAMFRPTVTRVGVRR
jgi:[acyl-carrier-protein] S-malonyltransferase